MMNSTKSTELKILAVINYLMNMENQLLQFSMKMEEIIISSIKIDQIQLELKIKEKKIRIGIQE